MAKISADEYFFYVGYVNYAWENHQYFKFYDENSLN